MSLYNNVLRALCYVTSLKAQSGKLPKYFKTDIFVPPLTVTGTYPQVGTQVKKNITTNPC